MSGLHVDEQGDVVVHFAIRSHDDQVIDREESGDVVGEVLVNGL